MLATCYHPTDCLWRLLSSPVSCHKLPPFSTQCNESVSALLSLTDFNFVACYFTGKFKRQCIPLSRSPNRFCPLTSFPKHAARRLHLHPCRSALRLQSRNRRFQSASLYGSFAMNLRHVSCSLLPKGYATLPSACWLRCNVTKRDERDKKVLTSVANEYKPFHKRSATYLRRKSHNRCRLACITRIPKSVNKIQDPTAFISPFVSCKCAKIGCRRIANHRVVKTIQSACLRLC